MIFNNIQVVSHNASNYKAGRQAGRWMLKIKCTYMFGHHVPVCYLLYRTHLDVDINESKRAVKLNSFILHKSRMMNVL